MIWPGRRVAGVVAAWCCTAALAVALAGASSGAGPNLARTEPVLTSAGGVPGAEFGAYEWNTSTWWPSAPAYAATLARLQALGVDTLYVDITEAVTLTQHRSSQLAPFLAGFAGLVSEADADGFRVDAVGGDPKWATTRPQGPAQLLAALARVEAQLPAGALDGVQFDVEPWGTSSWRRHAVADTEDWLRFVQTTVADWQRDGLTGSLGFTVPYWFDGATGGVPEVTFAGATSYPFQLSLGLLAPLPDTVLDVMAYRNTVTGSNGSEALFDTNLQAVVAAGSHTTLLFGQETGDVKPRSITFYGLGCAALQSAAAQIGSAFDGAAGYGGIAVDDVETLLSLCPA